MTKQATIARRTAHRTGRYFLAIPKSLHARLGTEALVEMVHTTDGANHRGGLTLVYESARNCEYWVSTSNLRPQYL